MYGIRCLDTMDRKVFIHSMLSCRLAAKLFNQSFLCHALQVKRQTYHLVASSSFCRHHHSHHHHAGHVVS